jgi:hypothetical protein
MRSEPQHWTGVKVNSDAPLNLSVENEHPVFIGYEVW